MLYALKCGNQRTYFYNNVSEDGLVESYNNRYFSQTR